LHKAFSRAVAFSSSRDRDTFIEDPYKDGRIKSVDDNTITVGDDSLFGTSIPDKFENYNEITSIGSYSMMATTKIT